ncbi:MAG: class III poly(R)-hydroxyalkanoic acid synthase subunit PhaC [Nitrososphaeraceae archaeon]|nr:class III poly(R)-hydroxyalkanoic acid synthase subunit PhaC [Nitrososphaeraceae archaeon]MDW0333457.1 class III poly(R)-hydroxyalkanoic acid synthase subunit PhaC [Nitrososphaeraceae archaeon]
MKLESVVPDKGKKMPEKEEKIKHQKKPTVEEALRILEEHSRKVEKTREVLHTAGNIDVGILSHEIVDETRLYKLLHYRPLVSRTAKTPIVFVYALMNKSYILDLQPDKSWLRNLLSQGFNVYLIDWKTPTNIDKYASFDDYVNFYIDDCVNLVSKENSVEKLTLHGYCLGSTMASMYTTLHQEKVRNLVTIAPIIDTENDGTVLANFARHLDVDKVIDTCGNFPREYLYACFSMLKPFKQGVNKYINLVENIDNANFVQNFLRMEKWLYDTPTIAGETFKQWIEDIYQKNLLVKNEMKIGENIIDLSKIRVPLLNIVAEEDHLVSPQCSVALNDSVSSLDKRLMHFHTGHVGLIASSYSQNNVLPKVGQWLRVRSQ